METVSVKMEVKVK